MSNDDLQFVKNYIATFQVCKKCGVCFQNHTHVYQGTTPLCKPCRWSLRVPIVVIRYNIVNNMEAIPLIFTQQYAIPTSNISVDMMISLQYLNNTNIVAQRYTDINVDNNMDMDNNRIFKYKYTYENPLGSLFHEKFPQELVLLQYSPLQHHIVGNFEYTKTICK
jgi:hypothetical protein